MTLRTLRGLALIAVLTLAVLPTRAQSLLCDNTFTTRIGEYPDPFFTSWGAVKTHNNLIALAHTGEYTGWNLYKRSGPDDWDNIAGQQHFFRYTQQFHFTDNLLLTDLHPDDGPSLAGLYLHDISDPDAVQSLGSILGFYPRATALLDDLIITIAPFNSELLFYDISDPNNPSLLSQLVLFFDFLSLDDIAVSSTYIYVRTDTALAVIDFADPTSPTIANELTTTPFTTSKPLGANNHTLVMYNDTAASLMSIADSENPQHLSTIPYPEPTFTTVPSYNFPTPSFDPDNNRVFIASGQKLYVYDVSNPNAPILIGTKSFGNLPELFSAHSNTVVYGNSFDGRHAESLNNLTPTGSGFSTAIPSATHPALDDTTLYAFSHQAFAPDSTNRILVYDTTDIDNPVLLDDPAIDPTINDLEAQGNTLFATSSAGFLAFDISDPTSVTQIGSLDAPNLNANAILVDNQTAYVLDNPAQTLTALDVSDPANPSVLSTIEYTLNADLYDLNIIDNTLLLSGNHFFPESPVSVLIDISDPSNMIDPGQTTPLNVFEYDETYIYSIRSGRMELRLRADGPASNRISTYRPPISETSYMTNLKRVGDQLIATYYNDPYPGSGSATRPGVLVIDINNPLAPTTLGQIPTLHTYFPSVSGSDISSTRFVHGVSNTRALYLYALDTQCRACAADFNNDMTTSPDDITAFLEALATQHPSADLNDDAQTDYYDINAFLRIYTNQCPG